MKMKQILTMLVITLCIVTSALSDSMAVYTKTLPAIQGTITATVRDICTYPEWSYLKDLLHQYKKNDIVEYRGNLYIRKDSGFFNYLPPNLNKSWILIKL